MNMDEQNRELVWNLFRDGLLLVSPLGTFMYRKYQIWNRKRGEEIEKSGDTIGCTVCETESGVIPMEMKPCKCVACYWCVNTGEKGICVVCAMKTEEIKPLEGRKMNLK